LKKHSHLLTKWRVLLSPEKVQTLPGTKSF